jgi:hypothetical protein
MKTVFTNTKALILALVTLFAASLAVPAFANNEETVAKAEVSYIGNLNDLPVYRLSLTNPSNEVLFVTVSDNYGNILYNEKLSGTSIVRNYQFDTDIYSEYNFNFTISNVKGESGRCI